MELTYSSVEQHQDCKRFNVTQKDTHPYNDYESIKKSVMHNLKVNYLNNNKAKYRKLNNKNIINNTDTIMMSKQKQDNEFLFGLFK